MDTLSILAVITALLTQATGDIGKEYFNEELIKSHSETVYPKILRLSSEGYRFKRSILNNEVGDKVKRPNGDLLVVVKGDNQTFYVELQGTTEFTTEIKHASGIFQDNDDGPNCLYRGKVISGSGGHAAVSLCQGHGKMSALVVTPDASYTIEPSEAGVEKPSVRRPAHLLTKSAKLNKDSFCGVKTIDGDPPSEEVQGKHVRWRRSITGTKIIEIAVYTDSALYEMYEKKNSTNVEKQIRELVLAIMNQVQLIYNYDSMKMKFKLVLVKLVMLKPNQEGPDKCDGDIDKYLDTFCAWQARLNPEEGKDLHWDHAIMLTGLDLYKEFEGKKEDKVLGLAWVNGMCRLNYSCTINEGKNFESAYVIAHELAHSLGVLHDGTSNPCDSDKFIMSDKTGPGKISWSSCTNDYMKKYFNRGQAKCLDDESSSPILLDFTDDPLMPGERFVPDEQCQLAMGPRYKPYITKENPFDNICREMWCYTGTWATPAHPALEGSSCKKGMYCLQGDCVPDTRVRPTKAPVERTNREDDEEPEKSKGFFDSVTGFFKEVFHKVKGFFKTVG